mgnify:CR=1 FL=1|tara:strand:+ start:261234 stop:262454 length:1221 start_codon:yes stop_codon:yes gene_type:complete
MLSRYGRITKNLLADIKETDLVKLGLYTACGVASSTWASVALREAGYGTSTVFTILAAEGIIAAIFLLGISAFFKHKRVMRGLWRSITWLAVSCWFVLAVTGFDMAQSIFLAVLLVGVTSTYLCSVCLFSDTLKQVQTGDAGVLKLVLFMIFLPLCKISFVALSGFLADLDFVYMATFLCVVLTLCNLIWHDHIVMHTMDVAGKEKIWHLFKRPKRVVFILLSSLFNTFNLPVRFVLIPLYLYEHTGGSLTKMGGVFALLGLVALFGQAIKRYMQGHSIDSYKLMLCGITSYAFVPFAWVYFFDQPYTVIFVLMLSEVIAVIWTYAYFIELRKLSESEPAVINQQWQVMNMFSSGVMCLFLVFVSNNLAEHMQVYLLAQGVVTLLYIIFFIIWWQRNVLFNKKQSA